MHLARPVEKPRPGQGQQARARRTAVALGMGLGDLVKRAMLTAQDGDRRQPAAIVHLSIVVAVAMNGVRAHEESIAVDGFDPGTGRAAVTGQVISRYLGKGTMLGAMNGDRSGCALVSHLAIIVPLTVDLPGAGNEPGGIFAPHTLGGATGGTAAPLGMGQGDLPKRTVVRAENLDRLLHPLIHHPAIVVAVAMGGGGAGQEHLQVGRLEWIARRAPGAGAKVVVGTREEAAVRAANHLDGHLAPAILGTGIVVAVTVDCLGAGNKFRRGQQPLLLTHRSPPDAAV